MKLGLKIEITSQGEGSAAKTFNSTPALEKYASASRSYIKEVFPAREDLRRKGIDPNLSFDESQRFVLFLRFLGPEGYLICIFQARPENSGRPYDGAAAWIYVPASVSLTAEETLQLIDDVKSSMSEERGINYKFLEIIFNKDYTNQNILPAVATIVSNGSTCGVRYYGKGTDFQLNEYLGRAIAQPVYGKYKAIFLLSKSDCIEVTVPIVTDNLSQICLISAPVSVNGFMPYFENGRPFNQDIEYPSGAPLTIVWKRNGFQDILKTVKTQNGTSKTISDLFQISKSDLKVGIHKYMFHISGGGYHVGNFQIAINGQILDDVLYVELDKLAKGVNIRVVADGFQTYSQNHTIASDQRIEVKLKRESFVYGFTIPMYLDDERIDDGRISMETDQKMHKCPIEGYSLMSGHIHEGEGYLNRLEFSGTKQAVKHFIYGFLSCFGIFCAIALYQFIDDIKDVEFELDWPPIKLEMYSDQHTNLESHTQTKTTPESVPNIEKRTNESMNLAKAVEELNKSNTWNFKNLSKYECLDGLFEDLNEYDFDALTGKWNAKLKDVSIFSEVVKAAQKAKEGGWNVRQGKHSSDTYNNENDSIIAIEGYISWIEKDQTQIQGEQVNHNKPHKSKDKQKNKNRGLKYKTK